MVLIQQFLLFIVERLLLFLIIISFNFSYHQIDKLLLSLINITKDKSNENEWALIRELIKDASVCHVIFK